MRLFISSSKLSTIFFNCLIFIILCICVFKANSQETQQADSVGQYNDWQIICNESNENVAENIAENCVLYQNIISSIDSNLGLSIAVLKNRGENFRILRILAPLGILLPRGIELYIDGENIGKIQFIRCSIDGCSAETVISDDLLEKLKNGNEAQFAIFIKANEGIGFPISLKGFAKAYDDLP